MKGGGEFPGVQGGYPVLGSRRSMLRRGPKLNAFPFATNDPRNATALLVPEKERPKLRSSRENYLSAQGPLGINYYAKLGQILWKPGVA